jgi:hypothetical protein
MATRRPGLSELELFQRTQEPTELAEQRRRDAKVFLKALQERDDAVTARMEKLKAARLAAEAAAPAPAAAAPKPAKVTKTAKATGNSPKSAGARPAARKVAAASQG